MAAAKEHLLEQIEQSRFQPLTEDSYSLCRDFLNSITAHDPGDLSRLLFYEGEYFFKSGHFGKALNYLSRFLQSPGLHTLDQLEALACLISGRIYCMLEQEPLAINYFLQCQSISASSHLMHEFVLSSLALSCIYQDLENYETALHYCEQALATEESTQMQMLTRISSAILLCKMGQFSDALPIWTDAAAFLQSNPNTSIAPSIWNLTLRIQAYQQERNALLQSVSNLCACISNDDILNSVWYFLDVSRFLLEQHYYAELKLLLDNLSKRVTAPFSFLHYRVKKYAISCPSFYTDRADYLTACDTYLSLHTAYLEEQRISKIYGVAYVERLQEEKNTSEMFQEKSRLDQMTGLLNKYTIRFLIEEDLAHKTSPTLSALLLVDLDHFKQVNDTLGHLAGDSIICQTASVIQNCFKNNALCGRVGGDEFVIYLPSVTDASAVIPRAELLRQEIYHKISQQNLTITTQASIGVAYSSASYHDYETLFAAADKALYRAKKEGRNRVVTAD